MTSLNDLIKESRKIEIRAKGLVDDHLSGEYKTAFKGRGIDFHDLREYLHGDEVRSIDWNTTARTGEPYIKQFVEQRELSIYLAIDITKSINYGRVLEIMGMLSGSGFTKVALISEPYKGR